jgi:predicted helicase
MTDSTSNGKLARIFYARVDEHARKEDKYKFLDDAGSVSGVEWQELQPDAKDNWLTLERQDEFESFISIGNKDTKEGRGVSAIFEDYSRGVETTRDDWVYNFNKVTLATNVETFIETYNEQVIKWRSKKRDKKEVDNFVLDDDKRIKWSRQLKQRLIASNEFEFGSDDFKESLYRPYTKTWLYFNSDLVYLPGVFLKVFSTLESEKENLVILVAGAGADHQTFLIANRSVDVKCGISGNSATQCFPFYTYNEYGTNRRENITDWALAQFRTQYQSQSISKLDIFHYVYALLHHPTYRTTYAANLKRELPRLPFVNSPADFRAFVTAGQRLADLHVNYEAQPEYPLERVEKENEALDWRVERMRLSKDKTSIIYNDFLTLARLPPAAFEYRLGNRSALEWIIDQYQVSTDKRSGITNDPNRPDEPDYIVKLIGKVTTVSVETVKLVRDLPALQLSE